MTQPPQQPPGVVRYGPGLPTPPPKKKNPTWITVGATVVAVCCGGALIMGVINTIATGGKTPTGSRQNTDRPAAQMTYAPEPAATSAAPPAPPSPAPPAGPTTSFATGTYEVGVDIKAGTYTCTATGTLGGYWERAKNASGELSAIIANDAFEGKAIVTVKAKEFFKVTAAECTIR